VYALLVILVTLVWIATLPLLDYQGDALYPKTINRTNTLDPYDRGGQPFNTTVVHAQYPENSPYLGYVTAYLTPLSLFLAQHTLHLGTTIVSHPGGIIDEILYNSRGLDTVVETSILFTAFAIASYLFRRKD
jgi:energy-converting hydrogenase A subunit F